jgi:hypothetical protein
MKQVLSRAFIFLLATVASAAAVDAQGSTPTPTELATARALLEAMGAEAAMFAAYETAIDAQLEQNPQLALAREPMMAWAKKYMTLEYMGDQFAAAYAEEFTEEELEQLLAFYTSPLGIKVAERTPTLTQKGAMIGEEIGERYAAELQRMILQHWMQDSSATPPR